MPLPPLATSADAVDYGYSDLTPEWLARASVRVRRFTKQDITHGTSAARLNGRGPWLLPQRPVTRVISVQGDLDAGSTAFELDGAWLDVSGCGPFVVTYDHGYATVPDTLAELVCAIASRMASMPDAVASGARTEQAGGEAVTWGSEAYRASSGLTEGEEDALREFYPKLPRNIVMRPSRPNRAW